MCGVELLPIVMPQVQNQAFFLDQYLSILTGKVLTMPEQMWTYDM